MARGLAFFDVDGTLITVTSIFRFLAFDLAERGHPPSEFDARLAALGALKAAGASREEANRAFFANFAGRPVEELAAVGRRWFDAEHAAGGLFVPSVLARLRAHRAAGEAVVLLSGSFPPCLRPLARLVLADAVLCTEPEVRDGRYTGAVAHPVVGARKAVAARELAWERGVDLADCTAYGDHDSDLPVLELVGHPVVVGDDPVLAAHADRHGWDRLPLAVPTP